MSLVPLDSDLEELRKIIKRDYGISVTLKEARSVGQRLVNLYSIVLGGEESKKTSNSCLSHKGSVPRVVERH